MDDFVPDWYIALDTTVLSDDRAWLNEWSENCLRLGMVHLEPLGWQAGWQGRGPDDVLPALRLELGIRNDGDDSVPRLWLIRPPFVPDPVVLVVGRGDADYPSPGFWPEVVAKAALAVGANDQSFDWSAVVGPGFGQMMNGMFLEHPAAIGPLRLTPEADRYDEYDPLEDPRLGAGGCGLWWWPIRVEGKATGHDWMSVGRSSALRDLHRLCGILSVAWNHHITVRNSPQPGAPSPLPKGPCEDRETNLVRVGRSVPDWADGAWKLLDEQAGLRDALATCHEGMALQHRHQSFALTAFISTIETVAQVQRKPERCEKCKQVKGSKSRFRAAVAKVLSPEQADLIADAYEKRSNTVHAGALYGRERQMCAFQFDGMFGSDEFDFEYTTLRWTRDAARLLLGRALRTS